MQNFNAVIDKTTYKIQSNFDFVKSSLAEKLADYDNYVVTEDSISASKKDLAELRKVLTSIDDARKQVKAEWLKPYEEFEERCDELKDMVNKPIDLINKQLKLFEEDRKALKRVHIKELYEENIQDLHEFLPLEKIYDKKWENVSTTDKDIVFAINEKVLQVKNDLVAIKALNSEIEDELIQTYLNSNNNLTMAIHRNSQYLADKEKITKAESKPEVKVSEESMGTLDEFVNMTKTVKIIVSKADLQQVKNCLDFAEIKYQIVED